MSAVVQESNDKAGLGTDGATGAAVPELEIQPLVFIVEEDLANVSTLVNLAKMSNIRCEVITSCAKLADALAKSTPDLIMLEVTTEGTQAVEALHALSQRGYPGKLQLMSYPGVAMVEPLQQLAQLHSLQALTPLFKPLEISAIRRVLAGLNSRVSQARLPEVAFEDAINKGWVQFWYQPKINFRNRTLVGVETFVRLFHPNKGLVPAALALRNAGDRGLTALAYHALSETSTAGSMLSDLGLHPSITINATLKALKTLPIARIFRDYVAKTSRQPNWIFDVSEEDIAENLAATEQLSAVFRSIGVKLAIDNFSGRLLPLAVLRELPISEIKLSSSFIANCGVNSDHTKICKMLIDLAHDLHCSAVAVGVETAQQSQALQNLGCDIGQGFLFGHPLPLKQITAMIKQRSVSAKTVAK